jgi:hypothetical protein
MLVLLQKEIDCFSCWAIGEGNQVNAWESCWIEPGLKICDPNVNIPITIMHATVSELSTAEGEWNWDLLTGWLPENIMKKLYVIAPPCVDHRTDIKVWPAGKMTGSP